MGFKIGRGGNAPELQEKRTSRFGVQKVVATETPIVNENVQDLTAGNPVDEQTDAVDAAPADAPVEQKEGSADAVDAVPDEQEEEQSADAPAEESENKPRKGGRKPKKQ